MCDYTMDPSGDAIFTLERPNAPLSVWRNDEAPVKAEPTVKPKSGAEPAAPKANEPPAGNAPGTQDDKKDSQSIKPSSDPVTFLVSSRHLILASPVFKAMLNGKWSEGDKTNGQLQIRGEGWHAEALAIVFNVIHGRNRQVPKTLTLEILAQIATIVDYYQLQEALQVMADLWIGDFRNRIGLPVVIKRELILWILVSWVFGDAPVFTHVTKVATLRTWKDLEISEPLPIPSAVIDRINQHRKDSMGLIASGLRGLRQDYIDGREGCGYECSAIHLGALTKCLQGLKLFDHSPEALFPDSSLVDVVGVLSGIKSPSWCLFESHASNSNRSGAFYSSSYPHKLHQCPKRPQVAAGAFKLGIGEQYPKNPTTGTLVEFGALLVQGIRDKIEGLRLADFVPDKEEG